MDEKTDDGSGRAAGGGLPLARLATIVLVVLALSAAALVALAVLNPEPQPHRIDYGGFNE